MGQLEGKIAWITGAGSGIGAAAARALAAEGARVVLTGRRRESLEEVAAGIPGAIVAPGDLADPATAPRIAATIAERCGRLDILVNNAGLNVLRRAWSELSAASADEVFGANLHAAFYCVIAALPMMRAQKDGLLIHTASFAGRFVSLLSGPAYSAAKHAVVAMSHSLNMEECGHGIRSTVICPGEVATPILERRPTPVSAEDRARMLRSEDCGDLIRYVACLPASVCLNEVLITPTWNRGYIAAQARSATG